MHKLIIVEHRIVADEKHHLMLADEVYPGHARHVGRNQQSRQTAQNDGHIKYRGQCIPPKVITAHRVGTVVEDNVAHDETKYQCQRHPDGQVAVPACQQAAPQASQFEKVKPHEHVVQTHPQGILQREEPVTDEWERKIE